MISVLSTTNRYIIQPNLIDMHNKSLEWLSATALWKRELGFFQKLLDQATVRVPAEQKQQVGHFQSLITYYGGELVDTLRSKLREHENTLASMLQTSSERDTQYFKEHGGIMDELESFQNAFVGFKHQFYEFVEKAMHNG